MRQHTCNRKQKKYVSKNNENIIMFIFLNRKKKSLKIVGERQIGLARSEKIYVYTNELPQQN